jgi:aspartyl-tRNA(Asn)/glutamyl-tRNA(Gln) amidotransferase subunit A
VQATDLSFVGIAEAARAFAARELSPVELTKAMLDRIGRYDGKLNAFLTVTAERALAEAEAAEQTLVRGDAHGPLLGIPIAYKDIYLTKGIRTTGGSALLADWVPEEDSTCGVKLTAAGSVMLGKVITHEFAFGLQTPGHKFLPARNPWSLDCVPGGSSSGSGTALAAGLCLGALGSDTGGSIRGPAAFCGITGLKPTYGRVSKYGVLPLAWSLDHAGPMARSVEDCALMLQALAGYDPKDPCSDPMPVGDYLTALKNGVKGLRIGVLTPPEGGELDPPVAAAYEAAAKTFAGLGATMADVTLPTLSLAGASSAIMLSEAYAYHKANLEAHPELYGEQVVGRFAAGGLFSGEEYVQAQRIRSKLRSDVATVMAQIDVLVMPVTPNVAPTFAESIGAPNRRMWTYMGPLNMCGLPALALPTGFSGEGLPTSMQIVGKAFDEATVLRAGYAFQQATDWHTRRPALAEPAGV